MVKGARKTARADDDSKVVPIGRAAASAIGKAGEPEKQNTPGEDAVKALNLGKMARAKERLESENGAYRAVVKHVEAKGLHIKAAKRAISISKSDDRDGIVEELQALFEYLLILGVPVKKDQLDMFRVEEPREPGIDKAAKQGRYAGLMGEGEAVNPYAQESKQGQAWLEAHRGGCEERRLILDLEPADDGKETLVKNAKDPEPVIKGEQAGEMDAFGPEGDDDEFDMADPARSERPF